MTQLYIHGLGQTPSVWQPVLRLMHAPDCIQPDLASMICAGKATYANLYTAFSALCDASAAPLSLCGLSLGGVLALHYAVEHPERVAALVLIAPQYKMPKRLLQIQNILFRVMPSSMFRGTGFSKTQFIELCGSMTELDFTAALPRISCPTLVVCGSRDHANKKACTELSQRIGIAELAMIEGAGHELNREAPELLAELLRGFYAKTSESSPSNQLK